MSGRRSGCDGSLLFDFFFFLFFNVSFVFSLSDSLYLRLPLLIFFLSCLLFLPSFFIFALFLNRVSLY